MRKFYVSACVLILLFLAACSSQAATPEPVTFDVDMSEYQYTPNTFEAKVGQQVTFHLVNTGQLEHEIMFGRNVDMENNRPSGFEVDMFEAAGVEPTVTEMAMPMEGDEHMADEHHGFMVTVPQNGATADMTFTVTEDMVGEWEIGCFLLEGVHYEQGMHGTFTVTK